MDEDDITAMSDWLKKQKISEDVVKTLVKEGYTSMEALAMLTGEDITDINAGLTKTQTIPQGQHKLILIVVVQLRPDESPATKTGSICRHDGAVQAEAAGEEWAERCPEQQWCLHNTGSADRGGRHCQRSQSVVMDGPEDSPEVRIW